jgi:phosphomethylpyrimidine synthase
MDESAAELSRIWLLKAPTDLHTAHQIGSVPDGHLDAGIDHCQQAAEDVRKYAAEQGLAEAEALKKGMEEKSREFTEKAASFTRKRKH